MCIFKIPSSLANHKKFRVHGVNWNKKTLKFLDLAPYLLLKNGMLILSSCWNICVCVYIQFFIKPLRVNAKMSLQLVFSYPLTLNEHLKSCSKILPSFVFEWFQVQHKTKRFVLSIKSNFFPRQNFSMNIPNFQFTKMYMLWVMEDLP